MSSKSQEDNESDKSKSEVNDKSDEESSDKKMLSLKKERQSPRRPATTI